MFLTCGAIIALVIAPFSMGLLPLEGPAFAIAQGAGFAVFLILAITLLEPLAIAALLELYFKVTAGQVPNSKWEAEIVKYAPAFMELKEKAAAWDRGHDVPFPGGRTA